MAINVTSKGWIAFCITAKNLEKQEIQKEYEIRKGFGLPVEFIDEANNPYSFDLKAGVIGKGAGAMFDPYRFTHHLIEIGCKNGLRIYENTQAVKVDYLGDGAEVETVYGYKVRGKIVIVATGYDTELFTNRTFGTKTTTFNIATGQIDNLSDIYKNVVVRDNRVPYNYFRTTEDNRLIIGGEDIDFLPYIYDEKLCTQSYDRLEQRLKNLFPDLKFDIEYRYCGAFASTKDNLGFIGKDPDEDKLWYCLGYGANGILFAVLGGIMLSKLYLGQEDDDMNLFKVDRFN